MIILKKLYVNLILFGIGAVGYGTIEILWRGRTHPSMILAGGISFFVFSFIGSKWKDFPLLYRCIAGSAFVTATELIFGLIFNVLLGQAVWDYSRIPFNFMGQICLLYSVLWGFLCVPFIPLAERIKSSLKGAK